MRKTLFGVIAFLLWLCVNAAEHDVAYSLKDVSCFLIRNYVLLSLKMNPIVAVSYVMMGVFATYKLCYFISIYVKNGIRYCYKQYQYYQQKRLFSQITQSQEYFSGQIQQTNQAIGTISQSFSVLQTNVHDIGIIEKTSENNLQHALSHANHTEQLLTNIKERNSYILQDGYSFLHGIKQERDDIDILKQETREKQAKTRDCVNSMQQIIMPHVVFSYNEIIEQQERSVETTHHMGVLLDQYCKENQTLLDSMNNNPLSSLGEISSDIQKKIKEISILLVTKQEGKPI